MNAIVNPPISSPFFDPLPSSGSYGNGRSYGKAWSLGAAAPILATGIGVALCGTTAQVGADIYEKVENLMEIKKAEKLLRKLLMVIDEIGQSKLGRKKEKNLSYLHYLAQTHELNDPIIEMLSEPFEFKRKQAMNTKEDTRHAPKVFVPIVTQVPPKSNFNARSPNRAQPL